MRLRRDDAGQIVRRGLGQAELQVDVRRPAAILVRRAKPAEHLAALDRLAGRAPAIDCAEVAVERPPPARDVCS